ncbi:uncharacterized protein LOC106469477 [Limulus polyphemus]|uniref:Uncharacterized protein LOC106469477 n=1 Tax=Limulus polyphemus TaxID=6850 RepID=A0ABM1BN97_LIMPO|nr:uncharacterized protein LOC106469477 [Limulus polyphemus]
MGESCSVKWGSEVYYLKEFTQKFSLPQVAKIIRGQYLNLGVPTLPSLSPNNTVFLASGEKRIKIAAQCVKFKENRRVILVGPKLAIPDNYEGWFEILSEDGRPVKCLESVAEMAKRFPSCCLVRENIKVFLSKNDDPENVSDKTRSLQAGETLHLVNEVLAAPIRGKAPGRFLRCLTSKKETVYLSTDQRGKFSPVAGEDNISGVHRIKTLLSKRLPLMVRLVHGKPPIGLKSNSSFLPEMRLYSPFEEECIMTLPLLKDSAIVPLPLTAPLKLQAPRNVETLVKLRDYAKLNEKCKKMIEDVSDRIQVFDISMSKELRNKTKNNFHYLNGIENRVQPTYGKQTSQVRRSLSDPQGQSKGKTIVTLERGLSAPSDGESKKEQSTDDYDEIDQIYDYVRGFIPLPEKVKTNFSVSDDPSNLETPLTSRSPSSPVSPIPTSPLVSSSKETLAVQGDEVKPEPPPIETIPARKTSSNHTMSQKITVSIVNKACSNDKNDEELYSPTDHIYEKVGKRKDSRDMKTSSNVGRIYTPGGHQNFQNNKFLTKCSPQHRQLHKTRIFKHSKSFPPKVSVPFQRTPRNKTCRSNKSITTSPIFNIRYKSLTNLAPKFNDTLESSNSGGRTSSGSGAFKESTENSKEQNKKLLRPKSLTNLSWEGIEQCNKYNLVQNELNKKVGCTKYLLLPELTPPKVINSGPNKRIGTLYL